MNDRLPPPSPDLKTAILSRIEKDRVCPRSRWFFRSRECVVWSLWLLTILIGALALAVTLYVVSLRHYALYEATHDNFITFMVEVLPYLWLIAFSVMVAVAVYNLRHTARGYRYPLWQILGSSLALSFIGGTALHLASVGFMVDALFGKLVPTYESQVKLEQRLWQVPREGRLIGRVEAVPAEAQMPLTFIDITRREWVLTTEELSTYDRELLISGELVRLLGVPPSPDSPSVMPVFHACGAFPWHVEKPLPLKDLAHERAIIMERIVAYKEKVVRDLESSLQATSDTAGTADIRTPCMNITLMRRLERP